MWALHTTKNAMKKRPLKKQPLAMRLVSSHAIIFTLYYTQAYCIGKLSHQCH